MKTLTGAALRKENLKQSRKLVHNSLSSPYYELRNAINDLGDEVTRLEGVVKKLRWKLRVQLYG